MAPPLLTRHPLDYVLIPFFAISVLYGRFDCRLVVAVFHRGGGKTSARSLRLRR